MAQIRSLTPPPRQAPYSIETEQAVLGGLLLDNRAWNDIADRLGEQDFYRADHQLIWRGICELIGAAKPCDFVTLTEHLRLRGQLEEAGGLSYLGTLANETPSAANVMAYADLVRERSVLRSLIAAGGDIAEMGYRPDGRETAELIDHAEQAVFAIRERGAKAKSDYFRMPAVLDQVFERIQSVRDNPGGAAGLPSGFKEFDRATSGLGPGDLMILAARPSMGKTSLAMNIAENVAIDRKIGVAVFSMEMSAEQLGLRVLSSRSGVALKNLRDGNLGDAEMDALVWAMGRLRESPLFIDEAGGLSPMDLRAKARRLKQRENIGLMVVDYIQLMQVPGKGDNRVQEVSEISRQLKSLAKELAIPIIALSQLNRGLENRDNKRPRMSDLRESGGIEQDADLVVFIYRDWVYDKTKDEREAEIIIAKQRNGPLATIPLSFVGANTKFEDRVGGAGYE
ncbi:primary replicative DNA helicase [Panacagrimonas perspica]|uniref:Replicative DNA helicase n=1 Tax=Panacagrimonas perspica TaxID=381431 RepID=A0A4V3F3R2_9GAMM|nr:replicative DNA helicase [Panacagrimonas perspica]TDU22456.1 primary replicative DNA helicase [Panacagrimonas perspica]